MQAPAQPGGTDRGHPLAKSDVEDVQIPGIGQEPSDLALAHRQTLRCDPLVSNCLSQLAPTFAHF